MRKLGQHNVDRIFDQSLANAEMPVSGNVWAGISSELEKDGLRRKVLWYQRIAVASVLLLIGLGSWMLVLQSGNTSSPTLAMGKPLREMRDELPMRPMTNATAAAIAQVVQQTQAKHSLRPGGRVRLLDKVGPHAGSFTIFKTFRKTTKGVMPQVEHSIIKEKNVSVLATADLLPIRPVSLLTAHSASTFPQHQTIEGPQVGALASLLAFKDVEKRREKEFAYVLDGEPETAKPVKHWEVGAGFAPDMSFSSTTPVQQSFGSAKILADDPTKADIKRLSPVMAYTSGVRAAYEINDRFSVRTGAIYSNRQSSTTAVSTNAKVAPSQSTLNLSTLEIPVSMRYNVITNKHFDYYVASGVSANFLLQYENAQVTPAGRVAARVASSPSDIMKPTQANVLVSTGLRYRLMDRLNLQVEPGMRYGVITNEYAFNQSRPISLNLLTGLNYHF